MKSLIRSLVAATSIPILLFCAVSFWACEGPGDLNPKLPPETRLSNIPPDSTLSPSPRLGLAWVGDDADGFVVAFKYRWNYIAAETDTFTTKRWTTVLNISLDNLVFIILGDESVAPKVYRYFSTLPRTGLDSETKEKFFAGDTVLIEDVRVYVSNPDGERYPVHTNPNSGEFIFDSPNLLNPHTFEIAAVDNDGLVDPTPAELFFTTPRASAPSTEILDAPRDTVFNLDYTTDTFPGILFAYQGIDKNSRTLTYQWVIDKEIWLERTGRIPWSEPSSATSVRITAADFPDPFTIDHTFYVRAINEFGVPDTTGVFYRAGVPVYAHRVFHSVYPEFKRPAFHPKMLVINNSYDFDTLAVLPQRPNHAALNQYYRELYTALGWTEGVDFDIITVNGDQDWPGAGILSKYSKVHFFGDVLNFENWKWSDPARTSRAMSTSRQAILTAYCNVGGKLIISGWNTTRPDQIIYSAQSPAFWRNILHISQQFPGGFNSTLKEYVGALPEVGSGYPAVPLDATKLDTLFNGALNYSWWYQLSGFGEILYRYNAKTPGSFSQGKPVAIRYLGITYDVFFLSFPLYYSDKAASVELLRKINQEFDSPR